MDRETIFQALHEAEPELRSWGVESLAVFGSVARGKTSHDSDLDILVGFYRPVGLFEFIRLKTYLEQRSHCRVDLVTRDALRPERRMPYAVRRSMCAEMSQRSWTIWSNFSK